MRRRLNPALVTGLAAFTAVVLLLPATTPAQDRAFEKSPYVADCKGLESSLAMVQKATSAIRLDLSTCNDLTGDDKSRCRKSLRDGYRAALETARHTENAAKKALACCQKPASNDCRPKTKKR